MEGRSSWWLWWLPDAVAMIEGEKLIEWPGAGMRDDGGKLECNPAIERWPTIESRLRAVVEAHVPRVLATSMKGIYERRFEDAE